VGEKSVRNVKRMQSVGDSEQGKKKEKEGKREYRDGGVERALHEAAGRSGGESGECGLGR